MRRVGFELIAEILERNFKALFQELPLAEYSVYAMQTFMKGY